MWRIYVFSFLLFLSGCNPPKYLLTTDPVMINSYQTWKHYNFSMLMPPEEYQILTRAIYIPGNFASDTTMETCINLLNTKKYMALERYLKRVDSNDQYLPISHGLLNFFRENYNGARTDFRKNQSQEIQFIIDVLLIDCEYELAYQMFTPIIYSDYVDKYQKILDKYELTPEYILLIKNRLNFIRYQN